MRRHPISGAVRGCCFAALLSLTACTAQVTSRRATPDLEGSAGIFYRLPRTEIVVATTYRLEDCNPVSLRAVSAELVTQLAPDPDAEFIIDAGDMSTPLKALTEAKITLENTTLKSINYEVDDRSRDVAKNLATAAINVAKLSGGGGLDIPTLRSATKLDTLAFNSTETLKSSDATGPECTEQAEAWVSSLSTMRARRRQLSAAWTDALAVLSTNPNSDNEGNVKRLRTAITELDKDIDGTSSKLTKVDSYKYIPSMRDLVADSKPKDSNCSIHHELPADRPIFREWFESPATYEPPLDAPHLCVYIGDRPDAVASPPACADSSKGEIAGICYRVPSAATLRLVNQGTSLLASDNAELLQFGRWYQIEFKNRLFQDNKVNAKFDATTGQLSEYVYSDNAAAEEIAGFLADVSGSAASLEAAQLERELAAQKNLRDLIKVQIEIQEELKKLTPPVTP